MTQATIRPKTALTAAAKRGAEAHAERREHAGRGERLRQTSSPGARGVEHQSAERDQHDQPEVGQREAERQPEPGQDARLLQAQRAHAGRPYCA